MGTHNLFRGSLFVLFLFMFCCQKDEYKAPEILPKTYSYSILNKLRFDISQLSETSENIGPYKNTLAISNIGNDPLSGKTVLWSFSTTKFNYDNLNSQTELSISSLGVGETGPEVSFEPSDFLFTDSNLIISVLSFNDTITDHEFHGLYNGELNIYETDSVFVKSVACIGSIDYQGKFHLFIDDDTEENIGYLKGNFNSNNLITGSILKKDGTNLSQIENSDTLVLDSTNLRGYSKYVENSTVRLLEFNLTNQK